MGPKTTTVSRALTVPQVCSALQTTRATVYQLIGNGALPAYKVGASWRIDEDDLQRYRERGKEQTLADGRAGTGETTR